MQNTIKNLPKRIYLQLGEDIEPGDDYKELFKRGITWHDERIEKTDVEYVLLSHITNSKQLVRKTLYRIIATIFIIPVIIICVWTTPIKEMVEDYINFMKYPLPLPLNR